MTTPDNLCQMISTLNHASVEEQFRVLIESIPEGMSCDDLYDRVIDQDIAGEYFHPFTQPHSAVRDVEFAIINNLGV